MPASWEADHLPLGGTSVRALYGSLAIAVKEGKSSFAPPCSESPRPDCTTGRCAGSQGKIDRFRFMTPYRFQRSRKRGWHKPLGGICCDRSSRWGNPFDWRILGRAESVGLYKAAPCAKV